MLSVHSENNETDSGKSDQKADEKDRSGFLETVFTILSLLLILGIAGYLTWQASKESTEPAFELKAEKSVLRGQFQAINILVKNSGTQAAKDVNISGQAAGNDGKPETAEATIDWLPGQSKRRVTLIFPKDTDTSSPILNVTGFQYP